MKQSARSQQTKQQPGWPPTRPINDKTDVALAQLLLASYGEPRPIFDRGEFRRYANGHWPKVHDPEVAKRIHQLNGLRTTNGLMKISSAKTNSVIQAIKIQASQDGFFDDAPRGVVVFRDRSVSLARTGAYVRPHRAEDRVVWAFPFVCPIRCSTNDPFAVEYIGLPTPNFERYLSTTFQTVDMHRFLGAWIGLTLAGLITRFELALILRGTGSNGKSVLLNILSALFRFAGVVSISPSRIGKRFQSVPLASSLLNLVDDLPEDERLDTGTLKSAISGGTVSGEIKHGPSFQFRPRAGHIFASNHGPQTREHSDGLYRRFAVVEFLQTFSGSAKDMGLADRIIDGEIPGVTAWAIQHATRALRADALAQPAAVRSATACWRYNADVVARFVAARCERCQQPTTEGELLYRAYSAYAEASSLAVLPSNRFAEHMERLGVARGRDQYARRYALRLLPEECP